jgi:hypothetical protein
MPGTAGGHTTRRRQAEEQQQGSTSQRPGVHRAREQSHEVTLGFWAIKILATTLGGTGGDAMTMSMNLGYLVGTIGIRTGNPWNTPSWEWRCGFYPGSRPGECSSGTAATFDVARADFGRASEAFLSKRTEADFQAWRHQRDWTAEKYQRFDGGERMPTDWKPQGQIATN